MPDSIAKPTRFDPYKSFKFRVKLAGRYVAGFTKLSPLPNKTRRSGGRSKYDAVTLERGVTHDAEFAEWTNKVWKSHTGGRRKSPPAGFRKDLFVDVYDEAGRLVLAYIVSRAWVSRFRGLPDLDANANAVAIEELKLEHEGFERDPGVPLPTERRCDEP